MNYGNDDYNSKRKLIAYLKFAVLLFILIGIPAFLYFKFGAGIFSKDAAGRIIDYLKANRKFAFLIIILIQMIQVIVCILPGQPIQFASSYMFGVIPGFILALTGAILGTTVTFYLAKVLGRDMVNLLFDKDKVDEYHKKLNSGKGLAIVTLIYLIPGVPKDLVSYVAGISDMKYRPFIILSSIARTPGMMGSLLLGHFVETRNYTAIVVLGILTALMYLAFIIKRKDIMNFMDKLENSDETK